MTAFTLPPDDRGISPFTGYTRDHWAAVADHLLLSLRPYFSPTRARVLPPGRPSAYGTDSDGLEGFARSFLLFGFRMVGEDGGDPHGFLCWYRDGLVAGTDPANPERWPEPGMLDQAKVEAGSIALVLQLTRRWLWDTLDDGQQQHVIDWLSTALGGWYPTTNWLWFRLTVETFLASVGGPHDPGEIASDLDAFESFYHSGGWYSDGAQRAYDYYCGWALHIYPLLWAASDGSDAFGARRLEPVWRARLADFLDDYIGMVGADGVPVMEGRSLIYRFAAAGPLWMGAYTGATRLPSGMIRRAASGILRAFVDRGGIANSGLLTLGFFHEWPNMAQSYSGSGSPYWAAKGMIGLALPADHPVWTAVEEPLPLERHDVRRVVEPAGWLLSGSADDGIVRLYNHGCDHGNEGKATTDSPLYARLGYSSATMPPLTGETLDSPVDNAVGAVGLSDRLTHRSGFRLVRTGDDGAAAFAVSVADTHWIDPGADTPPDHGSGRTGHVTPGPTIAMASLVRGVWEVRAARVLAAHATPSDDDVEGPSTHRIRVCGWPLSGATEAGPDSTRAYGEVAVRLDDLESELIAIVGAPATPTVHTERGTSPIGRITAVPWLDFERLEQGESIVVAVRLGRAGGDMTHSGTDDTTGRNAGIPRARVLPTLDGEATVEVTWPDGTLSAVTLPRQ